MAINLENSDISLILFLFFFIAVNLVKHLLQEQYYKIRYKIRSPFKDAIITIASDIFYIAFCFTVLFSAKSNLIYFKKFWITIYSIVFTVKLIGLCGYLVYFSVSSVHNMIMDRAPKQIKRMYERDRKSKVKKNKKKKKTATYYPFNPVLLLILFLLLVSWLKTYNIIEINMIIDIENRISFLMGILILIILYQKFKALYAVKKPKPLKRNSKAGRIGAFCGYVLGHTNRIFLKPHL